MCDTAGKMWIVNRRKTIKSVQPSTTYRPYCPILGFFSLLCLIPGSSSSVCAHISTLNEFFKKERVPGREFVTTYQTVLRCPDGECAGPCAMCSCCAVAPCGFSRLTSVSQLLPKCSERLQEVRFFFRNYTTPFCFLASPRRREQKTLIFLDQGRRD